MMPWLPSPPVVDQVIGNFIGSGKLQETDCMADRLLNDLVNYLYIRKAAHPFM